MWISVRNHHHSAHDQTFPGAFFSDLITPPQWSPELKRFAAKVEAAPFATWSTLFRWGIGPDTQQHVLWSELVGKAISDGRGGAVLTPTIDQLLSSHVSCSLFSTASVGCKTSHVRPVCSICSARLINSKLQVMQTACATYGSSCANQETRSSAAPYRCCVTLQETERNFWILKSFVWNPAEYSQIFTKKKSDLVGAQIIKTKLNRNDSALEVFLAYGGSMSLPTLSGDFQAYKLR